MVIGIIVSLHLWFQEACLIFLIILLLIFHALDMITVTTYSEHAFFKSKVHPVYNKLLAFNADVIAVW